MWKKLLSWLKQNVLPLVLKEAAKKIEKPPPSLSPRDKNPL